MICYTIPIMDTYTLKKTIDKLMEMPKGILAADESNRSMDKRLDAEGIEASVEMRHDYRELLLGVEKLEESISGVIFYDETLRQNHSNGTPFPKFLDMKGIVPGIKVDTGTTNLPFFPEEKITEGLDGLALRLVDYKHLGAEFAKWRAVITIGNGIPTDTCILANATVLARYAALCQEADIVPMVEPEVLLDGKHSIQMTEETLSRTLDVLFQELRRYKVSLPHTILKTAMVLPGKDCGEQATDDDIAERTARVLKEHVPADIGGVVFLSGGQGPKESTARLQAITKKGPFSWPLSFSYSRAVQMPALHIWKGKASNVEAARMAFMDRVQMNVLARKGEYDASKDAYGTEEEE